jgi:acyl-coenzyme A thioesterase PaaI-like protein
MNCARIRARLHAADNTDVGRARPPGAPIQTSIMGDKSLQEQYAPHNACWGCGPANRDGLHIRSFPKNGGVIAEWKPEEKYEAFEGVLNGGVIGTLLDCHCNWTAAYHLMKHAKEDHPPCTVTAKYAIKLLRPTPTNDSVFLSAKVVDLTDDRATIEGTLTAGGKVCATCRGIFVAVKEGHPAYHRW